MAIRQATLDMIGFGCGSCAYAIEKLGRKLDGIDDIRVDLAVHEIRVTFDDAKVDAPKAISALARKIGHDAELRKET